MPRDRAHLPLPVWSEPLPRRTQAGRGNRSSRSDRRTHGSSLVEQTQALANTFEQRREQAQGVDPKLVFRLRLNSTFGTLSEEQLERFGLGVLAREPGNVVVVFPNTETLEELRRRLTEYAGLGSSGHVYGEIDAIDSIEPLTAEDRIGSRLRDRPIQADERAPLDVEIWHPGSREECQRWISQLRDLVANADGRVSDTYIGTALCLVVVAKDVVHSAAGRREAGGR